jgi:hypothetical protein
MGLNGRKTGAGHYTGAVEPRLNAKSCSDFHDDKKFFAWG